MMYWMHCVCTDIMYDDVVSLHGKKAMMYCVCTKSCKYKQSDFSRVKN